MTRFLLMAAALVTLAGCNVSSSDSDATPEVLGTLMGERPLASFSAERYCQGSLPRTRVTVLSKETPVTESNEHSISSLTFSHPSYHKGQVILGSTETAFQMDMSADLVSRTVPESGESCSRLGMTVVVSMRFHVVNIAQELKPGTCSYVKVREHEYRHVAVNRDALYDAAGVLQREMQEFFGQRVFYGDPSKLRQELKVAIDSHWMPRLQQLKEAGLAQHQAIDTDDEYASNNTDCEGEIPALLRSDAKLEALLETDT